MRSTRNALAIDANGKVLSLRKSGLVGHVVPSADTNLHRLFAVTGTNTGTRTADTFEATGVDTTSNEDYGGWLLEITQAGYEQVREIVSNDSDANAELTLEKAFDPALPAAGNVTFGIRPSPVFPVRIRLDSDATGTLSIYRGNGATDGNCLDVLKAGGSLEIPVEDVSEAWYAFSVNAATEKFYLREGGATSAGGGGGAGGDATKANQDTHNTHFVTMIGDLNALNSLAGAVDRVIVPASKFPASAGVPETLAANNSFVRAATLIGKRDATTMNTYSVSVGKAGEADYPIQIRPGHAVVIRADDGEKFDLNDWSVNSLATGDGVLIYDIALDVPAPDPTVKMQSVDINDSTSGDNTIIAAPGAGLQITVHSVFVVASGTVTIRFEDGAGGTAFTGVAPFQAREGYTYNGVWRCSANTLFNMELSAAVAVHGSVTYSIDGAY